MTAKQIAVKDIKQELKESRKCFIAFRRVLDSVMNSIVAKQLDEQEHLQHDSN